MNYRLSLLHNCNMTRLKISPRIEYALSFNVSSPSKCQVMALMGDCDLVGRTHQFDYLLSQAQSLPRSA